MRWLSELESKVFRAVLDGTLDTDAEPVCAAVDRLEDRGLVFVREIVEPCGFCGDHEIIAVGPTQIGLLIHNTLKEIKL